MDRDDLGEIPPLAPPRVRRFRQSLIKTLPRWPNNRASLAMAERASLGELIIDYLNLASRIIPPRPREVIVESRVLTDPKWTQYSAEIRDLLDRCSRGESLAPYQSLRPWQRGFAPAAKKQNLPVSRKWLDKDFVLTLTGWHHFHLGSVGPNGRMGRTDDVLFVEVTRTTFTVICILGHGAFTLNSPEMIALNQIHHSRLAGRYPLGSVVTGPVIATSGHQLHIVNYAGRCLRFMGITDPKLDEHVYLEGLYAGADKISDRKPKLAWGFKGVDFGLFDLKQKIFFVYQKGWM